MIGTGKSYFRKISVLRILLFLLFVAISVQLTSCNIKLMEYEQPHFYQMEYYDIIISRIPFNDSIGVTYGMDLDTMKLRYITDKGIVMSKTYYNTFIAARLSTFHFSEAYIMDFNGNVLKQIPQANYYPVHYSYSRNHRKYLFTTDEGNYLIVGDVFNTNTVQISDMIRGTEYLAEFSAYSDKIAFVEKDFNFQSALYVTDTAGNNRVKVISLISPGSDDMLSWSPDNKSIVYSDLNLSSIANICRVNCDGSGFVNLTNSTLNQRKPSFSQNGMRIAFEEYSVSGIPDIIVIDRDGNQRVNITNSADEHDRRPSWSQSGRYLLYFTSSVNSSVRKLCIYEYDTHKKIYIDSVSTASWLW